MARGVADAGSLMVLSSNAGSTFEDDRRAPASPGGCRSTSPPTGPPACRCSSAPSPPAPGRVVLTADTPVVGTKYDGDGPTVWDVADPGWLQANFPPGYGDARRATRRPPTSARRTSSGWRAVTGLPVVVKGVLRPDDARRCVDAGAAAVWVSNHGGRQLDHAAATADCLAGRGRRGRRRRPRCTSTGECAPGGTRWPRWRSGPGRCSSAGRRSTHWPSTGPPASTRLLGELAEELVEALRLAGCAVVAGVPRDLRRCAARAPANDTDVVRDALRRARAAARRTENRL